MPPPVASGLARFKAALTSRFGARLRELVLFGSYARGDAHDESDVDVLVVVDGLAERERALVFDAAYDAAALAEDVDDWVSIAPLAYSAEQAADMRSREKRLMRDIDGQGLRL